MVTVMMALSVTVQKHVTVRVVSANRETEEVTGLPFMTDAKNEEALRILNS